MNTLYYGDNLDILRRYVKDETVDLIYLDPPFNTNRDFNVLFREQSGEESQAQLNAFKDTWYWNEDSSKSYFEVVVSGGKISQVLQAFRIFLGDCGLLSYLSMMAPRLKELRRVLKNTGSIYLHCDPSISHYIKLLMDAVFGVQNYRNEIVWNRRPAGRGITNQAKQFHRVADTILFYSKTQNWFFQRPYAPYTDEQIANNYSKKDPDGRKFTTFSLGDYSEESIKRFEVNGEIWISSTGRKYVKDYLDEAKGNAINTTWVDILGENKSEYPTQKPEALLERIIKASSKEGDVVLDPFCGGGTTCVVSDRLNRQWIGIDVTHVAISTTKRRIPNENYKVIGEPEDLAGAEKLAQDDPYQFQWWSLGLVGARPVEQKKGADKGIDGRLYFHDEADNKKTKQIIFSVKAGNVDVTQVRDLRGVIEREKAEMGVFICFKEPTQPMIAEAAGAGRYKSLWKDHPKIQIITVGELLGGKKLDIPTIELTNLTFKV